MHYADPNAFIASLRVELQHVLQYKLVGLYLFGSLAAGDFDPDVSDIDIMAAVASDINDDEFAELQKTHDRLIAQYTYWEGRIEIAYISLDALRTFKSQSSQIAIMSPGEPFHIKEAGYDWLINWYMVRENSRTLFGPDPKTLIDPISKAEFIRAVQVQTQDWSEWVDHMHTRPAQGYAILTMCRALYAYTHGEQVSKRQAALWAAQELPEWSQLIQQALAWRAGWRDDVVDHSLTFPETQRFVQFIVDRVAS